MIFNGKIINVYYYYIAHVFQGYTNNRTFIITQMPLEGTIIDLWRLVWDYNIKEIVMMNQSYKQKVHKHIKNMNKRCLFLTQYITQ